MLINMPHIIASIFLIVFTTQPSFAMDGNKLHALYSSSVSSKSGAHNFVAGVVEAIAFYEPKILCEPNVTYWQLSDTVELYLKDTPSIRHKPALDIIKDILGKEYGCLSSPSESDYH